MDYTGQHFHFIQGTWYEVYGRCTVGAYLIHRPSVIQHSATTLSLICLLLIQTAFYAKQN